jgi:AhpD family alkylhydroperoxidase
LKRSCVVLWLLSVYCCPELVLFAASVANDCDYCSAAHSTLLKGTPKVSPDVVAAIRANRPLANGRQDALVNVARATVITRGKKRADCGDEGVGLSATASL